MYASIPKISNCGLLVSSSLKTADSVEIDFRLVVV